jgi:hypothetical protein
MPSRAGSRVAARGPRATSLAAIVVVAALVGVLVHRTAAPSSSSDPVTVPARPAASAVDVVDVPRSVPREAGGVADGRVPDGATVFDDDLPAVANLDPGLLAALRQAAIDAARDGVTFQVNSGWRSPGYQERLLREAVAKYGSEAEAARWVATPRTSAHVSGDAVDIGPTVAAAWLADHGAAYGLCRVYGNEPWHYELRPGAAAAGCPPVYADPTRDPRMQPG